LVVVSFTLQFSSRDQVQRAVPSATPVWYATTASCLQHLGADQQRKHQFGTVPVHASLKAYEQVVKSLG
jgi:hypothetical protein